MFIRFVIDDLDEDSGKRQGLFQAARILRESCVVSVADEERLRCIRNWFKKNLAKPTRLAISSRPHARQQALSWFKDTADLHIANMREFGDLLECYGMAVHMIKARRIGYILYEDHFQVAAYPFRDTPT